MFTALFFGAVGYFMLRYGYSVAAAALAVVLARGFESQLRQGLNLFDNSLIAFLSRPITAFIVLVAVIFLATGIRRTLRFQREEAQQRTAAVAAAKDAEATKA